MIYGLIIILLFIAELFYFRIADRFNIIDKPNQRSSHTKITIRGGGVVFYLGALAWFIWSGFDYPWFFLGLTAITIISFLDDVFTLSNRIRLAIHLIAVLLMCFQLGLFALPWFMLPIALILIIGTINAYNFMDGINGITAMYSFAVLFLLWWVNRQQPFIDERLLYCVALANGVFAFFNFRQKAKCFAGDVGSVCMSFILLFALISLIIQTCNPVYILFLAVYGADSVLTIAHRLMKRENIFEAHRSHLYQYLANEAGGNRLLISFSYGVLQVLIGLFVIQIAQEDAATQGVYTVLILGLLTILYVLWKRYLLKRYTTI
ncbi:MraY family glycosyltransferase [Parapedobacter lycopersici]|uniref:MraY family glycosyltransferase n=1 Tax=Parapedobacter lycopersici TaxID=1864939 RepID=UPI00214DB1E5|nr:glycosyltransferase family 4 protein [Parapedobacter lycopersici]